MNALVAGAHGKTGIQVVELLAEQAHNVRGRVCEASQYRKHTYLPCILG